METEPILHVWIHTDNDLVDLTLTTPIKATHSTNVVLQHEVVHTNQKHPFFTIEKGFVPVGQIIKGMHVLRADGRISVITGWRIVPGVKLMYNLEVAQDHTFVVGDGQWVVHNCGSAKEVFQKLNNSGYQLEEHFINRWLGGRGNGLSAQNVVDVLQNGYHYYRTGDSYYSATKGDLTILYRMDNNSLMDIIRRGIPDGVTPLRNRIPGWKNPFYWMYLKP